jgi:hypothetical protein
MKYSIEFSKTVGKKTIWVIQIEEYIFAITLRVSQTLEPRFIWEKEEYWISTDNIYDIGDIVESLWNEDILKEEDHWMHP